MIFKVNFVVSLLFQKIVFYDFLPAFLGMDASDMDKYNYTGNGS